MFNLCENKAYRLVFYLFKNLTYKTRYSNPLNPADIGGNFSGAGCFGGKNISGLGANGNLILGSSGSGVGLGSGILGSRFFGSGVISLNGCSFYKFSFFSHVKCFFFYLFFVL
ncbi:hypothetical protein ACFQDF_25555 [Ectobacillus funiculus]